MSIYGLNFNLTQIPSEAKRHFAERLSKGLKAVGWNRSCTWLLSGVCENDTELRRMLRQANNGHRKFHIVRRHKWIAIYVS